MRCPIQLSVKPYKLVYCRCATPYMRQAFRTLCSMVKQAIPRTGNSVTVPLDTGLQKRIRCVSGFYRHQCLVIPLVILLYKQYWTPCWEMGTNFLWPLSSAKDQMVQMSTKPFETSSMNTWRKVVYLVCSHSYHAICMLRTMHFHRVGMCSWRCRTTYIGSVLLPENFPMPQGRLLQDSASSWFGLSDVHLACPEQMAYTHPSSKTS